MSAASSGERDCETCLHRCMDMDLDPYCSEVNKPFGQALYTGVPKECGPERLLWKKDVRASARAR